MKYGMMIDAEGDGDADHGGVNSMDEDDLDNDSTGSHMGKRIKLTNDERVKRW
jgi:hypothetical protein